MPLIVCHSIYVCVCVFSATNYVMYENHSLTKWEVRTYVCVYYACHYACVCVRVRACTIKISTHTRMHVHNKLIAGRGHFGEGRGGQRQVLFPPEGQVVQLCLPGPPPQLLLCPPPPDLRGSPAASVHRKPFCLQVHLQQREPDNSEWMH